jgi:membrane-bound ClpP family serine protease
VRHRTDGVEAIPYRSTVGAKFRVRKRCFETAPDEHPFRSTESLMSLGTILLIVLVLMLIGVVPIWPHASSWGYGPSGIVGVILLVVLVLFVMGRI